MFKTKSKKDKFTIEKEIEKILEVMDRIRPMCQDDYETDCDEEIAAIFAEMNNVGCTSDEYILMVRNLELLYKCKVEEKNLMTMYMEFAEVLEKLQKLKEEKKERSIPWKEIVVGTFGVVEIIMILKHEELNVITGKALGFVMKGRA